MTDLFNNYRIEREVGKGGMATIHLATDLRTGRQVALKFLLPHIASNEGFVRAFMEEFKANEFLRHGNIVEAIEAGQHDGRWFIAMEFLDGGSLKELLRARGRLPLDLAVHVMINVLKGLAYSHHCGVVHQDMKPANLMVQRDGSVKIADFGISKVASPDLWTPTGRIRGTPAYMAPEQAGGKEPNYRWDVFSSGVVFYELMSGFNPFGAKDPQVALKRITGENPAPLIRISPAMPHDLEVVMARMLEKDPDRRAPNADSVLVDLQRVTGKLRLDYSQDLFRRWLESPEPVAAELAGARRQHHLELASRLLSAGRAHADLALWHVYCAALVDEQAPEPRALLQQIAKENGFSLQKSNSMAIRQLESRLADSPDDITTLLQLARLYKAEATVLQSYYFCRTALSLAPLDAGVRQGAEKVLGPGKLDWL